MRAGWRCVLIGATALEFIVAPESPSRTTFDADAIVSVPSWDDYERLRQKLADRGFRRGDPHQMFSPDGVQIDIIPFGPGVVVGHQLTWPGGARMSALGFAEAFETATLKAIDAEFALEVVPPSTRALLKLIAYQDRPTERRRDVADIIVLCEHYEIGSGRRYDVDETVGDVRVSFDDAGAFLLGRDVRTVAHPESREAAARFFAQLHDRYATPVRDVLAEERRTFIEEERAPQILRLFRVVQAGLESV
jgi:predicted nucleotidyltransferase